MARKKRNITEGKKKIIRDLLSEYAPTDAKGLQEILKELMADTVQEMLEAEMEEELGYSKYDYKNKKTSNSRNGYYPKSVHSNLGEMEIEVPRDRAGEYEPMIIKKHQNDISSIEDKILSMYAKGMTTRDIQEHLEEMYGFEASPTLISKITDKVLPLAKEWQNRPLERVYPIVFMDAIHYNVRQDGAVVKKAVYIAIGTKMDGTKEVLGLWIGGNESAKFWLGVLTEIRNRGTEDIFIISVDGLKGFNEAIRSVYPSAEIQKCIIHQIRYTTKFVSSKDIREFMGDLKSVYKSPTEEQASNNLDELEKKWGKKYQSSVDSWRNNWPELSTYFKYPPELRTMIYTTNAIENFNRQLRKVTKSKTIFPTDDSLFKSLYLATMDIAKKWNKGRPRDWNKIASQLTIYFKERLFESDL